MGFLGFNKFFYLNMTFSLKKLFYLLIFSFFNFVFSQQTTFFRFNADYENGSALQNVYEHNVDISTRVDEIEELARGDEDSWGYSKRKTAYFSNESSYITSSEPLTQSVFGPHTISGEIFIKPFSSSGQILSWGETNQNNINIRLFDQGIILDHLINDSRYLLQIDYSFEMLEWYHINWFSKVFSDSISLGIYINGKFVDAQTFASEPNGFTIYNSPVIIGYNNLNQSFRGEIYAISVKNYFKENQYLTASIPYDGSAYFGIPNNHDYQVGSTTDNIDQRVFINQTDVNSAAFVPYQNDDFIPQGVTNTFEDDQINPLSEGMIYISLYHKPQNGPTGLKKSIVVEINPLDNYKVRRCFRLNGYLKTAHNGGIAFRNNKIYVSSIYRIEVYDIPVYEPASNKYVDLFTDSNNLFSVDCQSSFVTYFNDSLWVGEYRTSSEGNPYLLGYPLSTAGDVLNNQTPAVYRLPRRSQGVAWRIIEDQKYLYISQSNGGTNYGKIYRCLANGLSQGYEPIIDTTFNIPSGAEDLSFNQHGDLLTVSESGANYFHDSWSTFYPFYYSIPNSLINKINQNNLSSISNSKLLSNNSDLKVFPNPTNNSLTISYMLSDWKKWEGINKTLDLKIYNLLGELVYSESKVFKYQLTLSHSIDTSQFSSGSYFVTISQNGRLIMSKHFVNLK